VAHKLLSTVSMDYAFAVSKHLTHLVIWRTLAEEADIDPIANVSFVVVHQKKEAAAPMGKKGKKKGAAAEE
jgi:hypothetical protein